MTDAAKQEEYMGFSEDNPLESNGSMTDAAEWQVGDILMLKEDYEICRIDSDHNVCAITGKKEFNIFPLYPKNTRHFHQANQDDEDFKNITALERENEELKREKGLNAIIKSGGDAEEINGSDYGNLFGVEME